MERKQIRQRDEGITAAVEAVLDATERMPHGSLVTWEFIDQVTGGFNRRTHPQWTAFRQRLLREFPERRNGTVLWHVPGRNGGWTILTPGQQLTILPAHRTSKGMRQLHMIGKAVGNLSGLNHAQKVQQAHTIARTKAAAVGLRKARKEFVATTRSEQMPQRPRPDK